MYKRHRSCIFLSYRRDDTSAVAGRLFDALVKRFGRNRVFKENRTVRLIKAFCKNVNALKIKEFCDEYGIHQRKLERLFRRYVGVSPKSFQRINRFQAALKKLLRLDRSDFTTVAHDVFYYDQAHFIHDFKFFTGCSPSHFLNEKRSMLQLLKN